MGYSIDLDVGGTFTDCLITRGNLVETIKAPTTYYDLTVANLRALREGARRFGVSVEELLAQTDAIRYSTTIGTNSLIERSGPKLGLITTAGFEDCIFIGRARQWADGGSTDENKDLARISKPAPLLPRSMVVGLRERIDCFGKVIIPLNREEVLERLQYLVDQGVTGFVVGLLWSHLNSAHERMVREIIEQEYPETYLGNMPVVLSSEISPKIGEYGRIMTTVVNTYMHHQLSEQLGSFSNQLRDLGYRKPLILSHNTGGMKKVSRTRAIYTHNAGPVAGVYGALYVARLYGNNDVIFTDMGGTSFDMGVVSGGEIRAYDYVPVIDRWRVQIPAVETRSIGAGGGSIAWLNEAFGSRLDVGPMSARSMPGPAAYNQGGTEPTVTDADIVLGYLNPDFYLGGKMRLNKEKAWEAIKNGVADPLGIDVVEAAARIKRIIDAKMGQEIYKEVALKGHDPREFVLFSGGGAGPVHACGFNAHLEARRILTCPFSSAFGAFGQTTMDIMHVYEKSLPVKLRAFGTQAVLSDFSAYNGVVEELLDQARRDLELEGFQADQISLELELDMKYGTQLSVTKTRSPRLRLESEADVRAVSTAFDVSYADKYGQEAAYPQGGVEIETFYLKAVVQVPHFQFTEHAPAGKPLSAASKGTRPVYWEAYGGMKETPIYAFDQMDYGTKVDGPAVVESVDTTFVVEPGYRFTRDTYGNGIFDRL